MVVRTGHCVPNVKLLTETLKCFRFVTRTIVTDYPFWQSELAENVVEGFNHILGSMVRKCVKGDEVKEIVDCDQCSLAIEVQEVHAYDLYWMSGGDLMFWSSFLLNAMLLVFITFLDQLSYVILQLWSINCASGVLKC